MKMNLKGTIVAENSGGFIVKFLGFLPERESFLKKWQQPKIGDTVEVRVIHNKSSGELIVSRKPVLEAIKNQQSLDTFDSLKVNQRYNGRISNVTDYGVFVNINGYDALLHISKIPEDQHSDLRSFYKKGNELSVKIIGIDKDKHRVSLVINS